MSITSTVPAGVTPEKLPGITYDQLVAAGKGDMVLVDLRGTGIPATAAAAAAPRRERQAAEAGPDVLAAFAAKLGVPVVASTGTAAVAKPAAAATDRTTPARAAAPAAGSGTTGKLLVLVADSDAAASEVARQLRASGQYRFTILIGGTESIRNEGRVGTARMEGGGPATKR